MLINSSSVVIISLNTLFDEVSSLLCDGINDLTNGVSKDVGSIGSFSDTSSDFGVSKDSSL
jgi:hypothetical protein